MDGIERRPPYNETGGRSPSDAERAADQAALDAGDIPQIRIHLWSCGCLANDADAHRAGCPDYPEGRKGER